MWNILKPNFTTAYAAIGLCIAAFIVIPYLHKYLVMPGVIIGVVALLLFSTALGNIIKNNFPPKGIFTYIITSQLVVFSSLTFSIVLGGFINALVAYYELKSQSEASLKRMAEAMNFNYSDVAQLEESIQFTGYIIHPLINILLVGALPAIIIGILLGITNFKYNRNNS